MTRRLFIPFLLTVALVTPLTAAAAQVSTADDRARFLAGLPVAAESPLHALQADAGYKAHAAEFEQKWTELKKSRLDAMAAWAASEVVPRVPTSAPLFYIFGGPDFVTASVMYPDAPVYVLAGLEPIGKVAALESLDAKELDGATVCVQTGTTTELNLADFFRAFDGLYDGFRERSRLIRTLLAGARYLLVSSTDRSALRTAADLAGRRKLAWALEHSAAAAPGRIATADGSSTALLLVGPVLVAPSPPPRG